MVRWLPLRHGTVYVVQLSHFDAGSTDLPSSVMEEYLRVLDQAVAWCEQTETWPEESRVRYMVEQSWITWHYSRNRPAAAVSRFARQCRAGQIAVCALWANMVSDLLGAEEAARRAGAPGDQAARVRPPNPSTAGGAGAACGVGHPVRRPRRAVAPGHDPSAMRRMHGEAR